MKSRKQNAISEQRINSWNKKAQNNIENQKLRGRSEGICDNETDSESHHQMALTNLFEIIVKNSIEYFTYIKMAQIKIYDVMESFYFTIRTLVL